LGSFISWLISKLAGWPVLITMQSILLSLVFAFAVGVIFGLWPARRASRLLPVEALRYE